MSTLLAPIPRPRKNIFGIGLNYVEHVEESSRSLDTSKDLPDKPVIFSKPPTSVIGPGDAVQHNKAITQQLDWEVELAVIIGTTCRRVREQDALARVFGYSVLIDISARDCRRAGQWIYSKGQDTYAPFGPCIVTADEVRRSPYTRSMAVGERRDEAEIKHAPHVVQGPAFDCRHQRRNDTRAGGHHRDRDAFRSRRGPQAARVALAGGCHRGGGAANRRAQTPGRCDLTFRTARFGEAHTPGRGLTKKIMRGSLYMSPQKYHLWVSLPFLLLCSGVASAQHADDSSVGKSSDELATVVVTGSLIKRADAETPSPVQVISAVDLKESGYTNLSDVLRNLSANAQGSLGQSFGQSFAAGGQGVALRGLTVGGTLTLIDGERMVAYPLSDDNQRSFVDISAIPFNAVDSVEVLKDGASALYGADAIAGVVNVKLKSTFVGAEVTAEGGTSYKRDGTGYHLAAIFGTGDLPKDGYNAYVAIDFHHIDRIPASARHGGFANTDWSGLPGGINTTPGASGNPLNPYPASTTGYLINPGDAGLPDQYFLPGCTADLQAANKCSFAFPGSIQPSAEQTNVLARLYEEFVGWVAAHDHRIGVREQCRAGGAVLDLQPLPGHELPTGRTDQHCVRPGNGAVPGELSATDRAGGRVG